MSGVLAITAGLLIIGELLGIVGGSCSSRLLERRVDVVSRPANCGPGSLDVPRVDAGGGVT